MRVFWFLLGLSRADISCADYPECNGPFSEQNPSVFCGISVGTDPNGGPKCIYLLKGRDKFPEQEKSCEALKWTNEDGDDIRTGTLVTLNNARENNMTADYLRSFGKPDGSNTYYWAYATIGLRKTCRHCSWHWHSNEPFTYANWWGTEPNTYYYDCASIRASGTYDYEWLDSSCSASYPAICQFFQSGFIPGTPQKPKLPQKGGCKAGWWKYGGYCYKDFGFDSSVSDTSMQKTYTVANSTCWNANTPEADWPQARMAILPTLQHSNLIASLLGPGRFQYNPWVGIYNHAYYDYYFSLDNFDKLLYDNWAPGYPNNLHGNIDKCTVMHWKTETKLQGTAHIGSWINQHCTTNTAPWICSHEQDPAYANSYDYPTKYALDKVKCPRGWIPYHSSCYKLYNEPMTFDKANSKCKDDGPAGAVYNSLATGWDEYELLFLESFLYDDQLPSGTPDDLPNGYWIGIKNSHRGRGWGHISWIDNWPMTYTRWADMEPGNQDCGYVRQNGLWATSDCNEQRPFVCKAEFYDVHIDWRDYEKKLGPQLPCENGWESFGSTCVYVNLDKLSWGDADEQCQRQGGHLASIRSDNVNAYMTGIFNNASRKNDAPNWEGFWVGGEWTGTAWQWTDMSAWTYFNWNEGEPNNWEANTEDCLEVYTNGKWNDDECDKQLPSLCQKPRKTEYCEIALTSGTQKQCGEASTDEGMIFR